MANQVKTPIQNYFEKALFENGQHLHIFPSGDDTVPTVVTKTCVFRCRIVHACNQCNQMAISLPTWCPLSLSLSLSLSPSLSLPVTYTNDRCFLFSGLLLFCICLLSVVWSFYMYRHKLSQNLFNSATFCVPVPRWYEWVSAWLLVIANSAIFQLYHGENKLIINEMMMWSTLF